MSFDIDFSWKWPVRYKNNTGVIGSAPTKPLTHFIPIFKNTLPVLLLKVQFYAQSNFLFTCTLCFQIDRKTKYCILCCVNREPFFSMNSAETKETLKHDVIFTQSYDSLWLWCKSEGEKSLLSFHIFMINHESVSFLWLIQNLPFVLLTNSGRQNSINGHAALFTG